MRVSKITVARLFNLGNYEHKRVEITVELDPIYNDRRPSAAVEALEEIIEKIGPGVQKAAEAVAESRESIEQHQEDIITEGENNRAYYTERLHDAKKRLEASTAALAKATAERDAALKRLDALGGYVTES